MNFQAIGTGSSILGYSPCWLSFSHFAFLTYLGVLQPLLTCYWISLVFLLYDRRFCTHSIDPSLAVSRLGTGSGTLCCGASIKYVTLFLANFDTPLPLSHFVTHPRTPKSTSHISDYPTPRILVGLVQKPGQKPAVYKLSQLFAGVFVRGFVKTEGSN